MKQCCANCRYSNNIELAFSSACSMWCNRKNSQKDVDDVCELWEEIE